MAEDPRKLGASEPCQQRDGHGARLVDPQVGHEPFVGLVVPDAQSDAVAPCHPPFEKSTGEPVRSSVPLAERHRGARGDVAPRHTVVEFFGELAQELGLEQRHADGGRAGIQ
jgi:hypothetical protein